MNFGATLRAAVDVGLFSFLDPAHERRVADWVRARHPQLYVSLSSEVAPRLGEYERCVSTAFNSYIGPTVADYVARLETALKARGLRCSLLVMQASLHAIERRLHLENGVDVLARGEP